PPSHVARPFRRPCARISGAWPPALLRRPGGSLLPYKTLRLPESGSPDLEGRPTIPDFCTNCLAASPPEGHAPRAPQPALPFRETPPVEAPATGRFPHCRRRLRYASLRARG